MTFNVVESWLDNVAYSHSGSVNTRTEYQRNFSRFCKFIERSPIEVLGEYEQTTDRAFKRKHAQYIKAWIGLLMRKGYTKSTIKVMVASVKSFFKYNDLPLGYIPMGNAQVVFHNRDITKEEIENIIDAANRARDRAFFAVMAQSGLRPFSLCLLRLKHVELDREAPVCLKVPQELAKGKYRGYLSFIGPTALKYLRGYLNRRANLTPESWLFSQHDVESKLDRRTMSARFRDAVLRLRKKGVIEYSQKQKGKAGSIRLYSLRKFFRKYAGQAGDSHVQFWMGHVLKNQDEHYFPKDIDNPETVEHHRQIYAEKAMPYLVLETERPDEFRSIIREQTQKIERLEQERQTLQPFIDIINSFKTPEDRQAWIAALQNSTSQFIQTGPGGERAFIHMKTADGKLDSRYQLYDKKALEKPLKKKKRKRQKTKTS